MVRTESKLIQQEATLFDTPLKAWFVKTYLIKLSFMGKYNEIISVGDNIRRLRKKRGYAQEKFAYHIEIGRAFYGRIERGEMAPGALTLIKIVKALNVEVGELFPSLRHLKKISPEK